MPEQLAYLGLGANLGRPHDTLIAAIDRIGKEQAFQITQQSGFWKTKPVDSVGPDFCNAVIEVRTGLTADEILKRLLAIEQEFGRTRSIRNAPRTLDLDLIAVDGVQMITPDLILPHPRAHLRAFVLVPLCEINPSVLLGHPQDGGLKPAHHWQAACSAAELGEVTPW
jgi:2-amino-4-hydroxy-6-hydroxymethyldihydropteridine diphosphokinase